MFEPQEIPCAFKIFKRLVACATIGVQYVFFFFQKWAGVVVKEIPSVAKAERNNKLRMIANRRLEELHSEVD